MAVWFVLIVVFGGADSAVKVGAYRHVSQCEQQAKRMEASNAYFTHAFCIPVNQP